MSDTSRRDMLTQVAVAGAALAIARTASAENKTAAKAPVAKPTPKEYVAQSWKLDGMKGLEKDLLDQHYALYQGYVKNTNKDNAAIAQMIADGKADSAELSETRRRLGFEYAGMRLHELYFGAMKPDGSAADKKLASALTASFGSQDAWKEDFVRTGMMRGIGWAILYQDPSNGALQNFWVTDHENGHPPGFRPIVVMDVWEHAYIKQFGASGRKAYIDAWFANIDWSAVGKRLG